MPSRLDSRSLALFLAVAEARSFRQAAETLHMSQPPLSRAIRELEERLGVRLLERHTQGVLPTDAGRRLLPFARGVEKLLRQADAEVATPTVPPKLRLGLTSAAEPVWFRGLAERVLAAQPQAAVTVVSDTSPRLVRQLRSGRLDAAFVALPVAAEGLDLLPLDRLPMLVALPSAHPLARRKRVALADLAAETVFWFERARQPAFYDHCARVFARHGFAPATRREPADQHVLLAEVAHGQGLALLPSSFAALRRSGVVYRALQEGDELAIGIGLLTAKDRPALRAVLVEVAGVADVEAAPVQPKTPVPTSTTAHVRRPRAAA